MNGVLAALVKKCVDGSSSFYGFRWRSSLRLSLKEILSIVDLTGEFRWRRKLWFEIGKGEAVRSLTGCTNHCLVPFFKSCAKEGFEKEILQVLDGGKTSLRIV